MIITGLQIALYAFVFGALTFRSADGSEVTSCWGMTWRERLRLLMTGRVYLTLLTFGRPLQPQIVSTEPPAAGGASR